MTTPTPAEPKYSDAEIHELALSWQRNADGYSVPTSNEDRGYSNALHDCASALLALLAYRQATPEKAGVSAAVPNDDAGHEFAEKHHLFIYEVDFGDEGKGRYIRLNDFNKVIAKLESQSAEAVRVPDGWKLAMCVLQSGLYQQLPGEERAVCDALIRENPYIALQEQSHD